MTEYFGGAVGGGRRCVDFDGLAREDNVDGGSGALHIGVDEMDNDAGCD